MRVETIRAEAVSTAQRMARYRLTHTAPVTLRDLDRASVLLKPRQWAVACTINGTASAQDLAWELAWRCTRRLNVSASSCGWVCGPLDPVAPAVPGAKAGSPLPRSPVPAGPGPRTGPRAARRGLVRRAGPGPDDAARARPPEALPHREPEARTARPRPRPAGNGRFLAGRAGYRGKARSAGNGRRTARRAAGTGRRGRSEPNGPGSCHGPRRRSRPTVKRTSRRPPRSCCAGSSTGSGSSAQHAGSGGAGTPPHRQAPGRRRCAPGPPGGPVAVDLARADASDEYWATHSMMSRDWYCSMATFSPLVPMTPRQSPRAACRSAMR